MEHPQRHQQLRRLSTPRSAALAGVIFAVLFAASLVLLRSAIPDDPFAQIEWVSTGRARIGIALTLAPVAGTAFLWFIGVMRDSLGELEDRFFSSVFLGSGLLFLAMTAVSMAIAGAILMTAEEPGVTTNGLIYFGRSLMLQVSNVWGVRMAAVFMISLATIWFRTRLMPRWTAVVTYGVAATLLAVVSLSLWVTLVFPVWVCLVSVLLLPTRGRSPRRRTVSP
ncbi:hypothetical protein [Mycolicibacterium psychrotolerans]|uniref:DUF4386 domain-containing protein n=1 Tax=Mycolicibacterium psychrotolerans TaxID=216929 RepID=A0A7I7MIH1_9MYCO|nr:hypothetical protein [Mycolicibacterium psychrotolerans]BBX71587.1 hypothetical protein MPSYJ_50480 [Mycolicibacterium psychrotolerans]